MTGFFKPQIPAYGLRGQEGTESQKFLTAENAEIAEKNWPRIDTKFLDRMTGFFRPRIPAYGLRGREGTKSTKKFRRGGEKKF